MATVITSECINCGACEPECPNTAIYQGGVEWDMNGAKHAAISQDIFYIVPEKCTECVGFFDHEACAAVCPVDCCVPDPKIPETEDVLIARARELHADKTFDGDFPSRFKEGGNGAAAGAAPVAAGAPAAAAPAAAPAAKAPAAATVGLRVERPLSSPRAKAAAPVAPMKEKAFPGELPGSFESALAKLGDTRTSSSKLTKWVVALAQPLLGALPYGQKKTLEEYIGDARFFTAAGATGANALKNMIIYPIVCAAFGAAIGGKAVFSDQLSGMIMLGIGIGIAESMIRMREGLRAMPADKIVYRAAWYGWPLAPLFVPVTRVLNRAAHRGSIAIDGFHGGTFEDKIERERRYGEVYNLDDKGNGYLLRLEFPRRVPQSALKEQLGIADTMPGYDYELAVENGFFVVKGSVADPNVRKLAAVSPAFPPDFTTNVELPGPISGFKHRIRDRVLEVVLLKR